MEYEATIGLEIHVEMNTVSKMFSSSRVGLSKAPNTLVTPYDLAFPGTMPLPNRQAVINAIRVCNALHMEIDNELHFDRKNYFYSDLPKGYQITQDKRPIGKNGYVMVDGEKIEIERLHMEEDTAKQLHFPKFTLLDYNRAGIPLIEIVTRPCIHSPSVAAKYAETIKEIVSYLEVSEGKMEDGQLRCDVNISIKRKEDKELGTKVEIKNINSFQHIKLALEYEINRQIKELESNNKIVQETRRFDDKNSTTVSMRLKTDAVDYKYYPEANIIPIKLSKEFIENAINTSNELASIKRERYINQFKLSEYDTNILLSNLYLSRYFDECTKLSNHYKSIANWIIVDVLGYLNKKALNIKNFSIEPKILIELINEVDSKNISTQQGREIFNFILDNKCDVKTAKEKLNISNQISDDTKIRDVVLSVLGNNEQSIIDYLNGKDRALSYLIGQVMKITHGKVNPALTSKIILEEINKRKK